ncbi:response regulator transcription factor [Allosphingosinicella deserti]|uniref:DNA-binding response regulator n=1 Tax=Allosphingosinicella deserti TaxID=2116704 RepID=A0A2P7QEJ3_9SPHN|nr:response regulator transcription factor [Sphingomonas deserti]PSJ36391.1 DNA-binding response regulator [Sphingomonas deserti]
MSDTINVALVGRNSIVREGLCRILADYGFTIRASVESSAALKGLADAQGGTDNCLVVVDIGTDGSVDGIVGTIHETFAGGRVVLLADQFDFETMLCAFRQGASGYIVKEISCEPLIMSLQLAATGEKVMPSQLADQLPTHVPAATTETAQKTIENAQLSDRETEILRCLIMGCPNKIISRQLDISEATVKVHVKAILRKIRVHNRTQAAIWAVNRGLEGITLGRQQLTRTDAEPPQLPDLTPQMFAHEALAPLSLAAH